MYKNIFKRYELKYLISDSCKEKLKTIMKNYMTGDSWGKSNIVNLYYDTPDYLLIRHSIEKPVYKEKLRIRSYGRASPDSPVFIELKKKYKHIVYKRRIPMAEKEATEYLKGNFQPPETQIIKEMNYCLSFYDSLEPRMYISYDREAFFGINDSELRITFDSNILWRNHDLSLCSPSYGEQLLEKGFSLMEIKVADAMPLWLASFLSQENLQKTSFSKYGNAYKQLFIKGAVQNDR